MSKQPDNILYEKLTETPGHKPSWLFMSLTKAGGIHICRQTFGPRGGVFMCQEIILTSEEWKTLKSQETGIEDLT